MGWTGYHVNSPVRRKYECDKYNIKKKNIPDDFVTVVSVSK